MVLYVWMALICTRVSVLVDTQEDNVRQVGYSYVQNMGDISG